MKLMNNIIKRFSNNSELNQRKYVIIRVLRFTIQLIFLFIINLALGPYPIPLPILGLSAPWSTFPGAFELLQIMIALLVVPIVPVITFILSNIFLGRIFCGWLCPFGLAQDIAALITSAKRKINPKTHEALHKVRWIILTFTFMFSFIFAYINSIGSLDQYKTYLGQAFILTPYNAFSPDTMIFATIPLNLLLGLPSDILKGAEYLIGNGILMFRFIIMILVLIGMAKIERFWCRYGCPVGLLNGMISKYSIFGIYKYPERCDNCGVCNKVCPVQIDIAGSGLGRIDHFECISCMQCVFACDRKALKVTYKS
jgi:polyferredoxin